MGKYTDDEIRSMPKITAIGGKVGASSYTPLLSLNFFLSGNTSILEE